MADPQKRFHWTERRTARLATMLVSGAVVVADLLLLIVFLRSSGEPPRGLEALLVHPGGDRGRLPLRPLPTCAGSSVSS